MVRHHCIFAALLTPALLAGCVTSKPVTSEASPAASVADPNDPLPPGLSLKFKAFLANEGLTNSPAKAGQAARLTAAWNNKIVYAPDPTHGGEPVPGLIAKVWLFGTDEAIPVTQEGELIIGMWDNSQKAKGGPPPLLELWHIDQDTAKRFRKRDFMGGEAYTLFLPSSKYHVDLKQVNMVVRFNGADSRNLVTSPETLSLDHSSTLQRAAEKIGIQTGDPLKFDAAQKPAFLPLPSKTEQP
jgi:hypothetical protein